MKFRKLPVVVDAFQFVPGGEWPVWATDALLKGGIGLNPPYLEVHGRGDEVMTAYEGDWIIQGVTGEMYPCPQDVFEKTYEAVDE